MTESTPAHDAPPFPVTIPSAASRSPADAPGPAAAPEQPAPPAAEPLGVVSLCVALCALLLTGLIAAAPLPTLLDRFVPDDAFYYYKTAWNVAATGFSSFDGIHPTNGYQPLWFLLCVPVFWMFPQGGEPAFRFLLLFQALCYTAGSVVLFRALARPFGVLAGAAAMCLWLPLTARLGVNGLETAVLVLFLGLTLSAWLAWFTPGAARWTRGRLLTFGLLAGLLFLARTDTAFVVLGLGLALWWRARRDGVGLVRLLWCAVPLLVLAGGYLAWNLATTGHLMPVSGAAKQFHSGQLRAVESRDRTTLATLRANISWTGEGRWRYVLVGMAGPWALWLLSLVLRLPALVTVRRLWPFYLGGVAAWAFYCIVFYGGFSRTQWYYVPQTALAAVAIAAAGAGLAARWIGPVSGVVAVGLVGWALRWPHFEQQQWIMVGATAAGVAVLGRLLVLLPCGLRHGLTMLGLLGAIGFVVTWGESDYLRWLVLVLAAFGVPALLLRDGSGWQARALPACLALAGTTLLVGDGLRAPVSQPPSHWNYNLYLGATWARDHLPEDATIWSGSTGILGYFSHRTCVNTDGLISSHEFLRDVLQAGKLGEFYRRWDYAIDAFGGEELAAAYPEGAFVPLPPELQAHPFPDGELTRMLRVFRMDADGPRGPR